MVMSESLKVQTRVYDRLAAIEAAAHAVLVVVRATVYLCRVVSS